MEPSEIDRHWMSLALEQARAAARAGEVPVGAVIVRDGELLAQGHNAMVASHDPSAHAEIVVLRRAGLRLGNYRLPGCTLYASLEPCAMCAGAILHARLERLVYGARDPRAGAVESCLRLLDEPFFNHRLPYQSGVLAADSARLLQTFFRSRRQEAARKPGKI